eukprot:2423762-Pyramimonas_sp.AAC.1
MPEPGCIWCHESHGDLYTVVDGQVDVSRVRRGENASNDGHGWPEDDLQDPIGGDSEEADPWADELDFCPDA